MILRVPTLDHAPVSELLNLLAHRLAACADEIGQVLLGKRKVDPDALVLLDPMLLPELEEHPNQPLPDTQGCQVLKTPPKPLLPEGKTPKDFPYELWMLAKKV